MDGQRAGQDSPAQAWARALASIGALKHQPTQTLPALIDRLATEHGERPALLSDRVTLSYRGLAARKNQIARWALENGLGPGRTVCLMMANCPDYVAIWLGLTQTGTVVSLINTNLLGDGLVQAIGCSPPAGIITDAQHATAVDAVRARLEPDLKLWRYTADQDFPASGCLAPARYDAEPLSHAACPPPQAAATALLVFTSGTTGLPKAARISHYRILEWSYWFAAMTNTTMADRLYDCLPLYHSTGGIAALGGVLVKGGAVVIRERFSASRFWDDVGRQSCTLFLYIGELCRYLTNAPPHPRETQHRLRLCYGNGLRADIWVAFQNRFQIPKILEFYASTEGNISLYNCESQPGAIGRIPPILRHRFPIALVACDPETGDIARGDDGYCRRCPAGEAGEALGAIAAGSGPSPGQFEGYTDAAATAQKILRNVFRPGDVWFRTGDLMRQDAAGFFYFVERIGDTFRWKGENVSALQVADVLRLYPGITDAIVYGVAMPGEEGKAGMAAITTTAAFDLSGLAGFLTDRLPVYAWPVFLRLRDRLETTATFKPIKAQLLRDGYDTGKFTDALYAMDAAAKHYRRREAGRADTGFPNPATDSRPNTHSPV